MCSHCRRCLVLRMPPPVESFYSKLFLSEDQNSKLVLRITQDKEVRNAAASWTSEEFGNGQLIRYFKVEKLGARV